ncbi:hypothetical protein D9758_005109 [Tetrapyrgos nigripes]|uniref:Cytochrome P450 n=1 Tax=Tetrapyrgos nigripes TaxID=182062 RepID=A0A8H5GWB2_9AGAR|nr:hypothetical protein D9758_005109 [Tetrapyrgos nigripes]
MPFLAFLFQALFLSALSISVYRIFFHPLRKFPGPRLAAVSTFYQAYYDIIQNGKFLEHLHWLHNIYGPVVRIGPNKLHFSTPEAYHDIYTHGATFTKSHSALYGAFGLAGNSFTLTDLAKARERRAVINPLFSRRSILKLEGLIQDLVDQFLFQILSQSSSEKSVNMTFALRSLTMDIITSYCFATSIKTIDYPGFMHPIPLALRGTVESLWIQKHFPFLMQLPFLISWSLMVRLIPGFAVAEEQKAEFRRQIEKCRTNSNGGDQEPEHQTVFHYLLAHQGISDESLVEEAFTLIGAGSDTVANACIVGINAALTKPEIGKRLIEELREAWPDGNLNGGFGYARLEKLPYLTAFIKESLRCSFGVVSPLPRVVGPGDAKIGGCDVPSETIVATSCVFLHQNPDGFPNPSEFSPERWLEPGARDLESRYLVPFSRGTRLCLGLNLAWAELYLVLGNMFRKLDMDIIGGKDDDYIKFREIFIPLWKCQHLNVVATQARG